MELFTKYFLLIVILFLFVNKSLTICKEINGTIKNIDGNALIGARIQIENSKLGAVSDSKGRFVISNILQDNFFIIASYTGYKAERKEIIRNSKEKIELDFVMSEVAINLNDIVVTANKREENLQTIPVSVSAITSDRIEDLNIRQRTDLMAISPNTLIAETGSHLTDLINIRGVFPSNFFTATSLFYYEGVPIFGYGQNPMYLNDIERIEILKGPQGTLYGRNSLAGVINIVSKKPNNTTSCQLGLNYGNYNDVNINFGVSSPLIENQLFARLSGYYYSKDGYYTNTFNNSNAGWSKGFGGTVSLRYFPSEVFSAELFGNIEIIDESIWTMTNSPDSALANPFKFARNFDSFVKKNNLLGSLKLSYSLDFMNIISTTAYQNISGLDWKYDADFTQYDFLEFAERSPNNIFSEEIRFENKKNNSVIKWIAGVFYLSDENDQDYNVTLNGYKTQINQIIKPIGMEITQLDQFTKGTMSVKNTAIFGNLTYTFLDNFDFTIGYRYEKGTSKSNWRTYLDYTGTLPNPVPDLLKPSLGFLNVVDTINRTLETDFLSHKYALAYRIDTENMIFASVTSGVHGGGFNSGVNKLYPTFDNEYTWNYELGFKGTFLDSKLRINSSIFLTDWSNQQLLVVGDLSNPLQTMSNAGKTQIKGYELELTAIITKGLSFNFSFGYLDAELTDYKFTDKKNGNDTLYDYSGNKLPFSPEINSLASFKYEYPADIFGIKGNLSINFDLQFIGSYYSSHINIFKSEPRNLFNSKFGYFTKNYDIYFWIRNLADLKYVYGTFEYRGGHEAFLGAPRTLGLSLNFKF